MTSKLEQFWDGIPRDSTGDVVWPGDQTTRQSLLADILGATIVGAMETVLADNTDLVRGVPPEASQNREEAEFSAVFRGMSQDQREAVVKLLRRTAYNLTYRVLLKLQRAGPCGFKIVAEPYDADLEPIADASIVVNTEKELHWMLAPWVDRFSDGFSNEEGP